MNKYLVDAPDATKYPNWKGPYVDPIFTDPFDRAYLVNVQALYKIDVPGTVPCGFGWVMSGGPNRELETSFFVNNINPVTSDDIGRVG